jgi:hypothetical protein
MFGMLRLAAVAHLMDLGLSCLLLSLGWMQEANPLAAVIYQTAGLAGLIGFKMTFLIAAVAVLSVAIERRSMLAFPATAFVLGAGVFAVTLLMLVMSAWLAALPDA